MQKPKKYNVINGAFLLAFSTLAVRIIGMLYKIPLTNLIGAVGRGYFSTAYNIFTPVLAISMAGLPVAISRLVSKNTALRRYKHVKGILRVSIKCFTVTGIVGFAVLLAAAYPYAKYIAKTPNAVYCIFTISPSLFFCCMISALRSYYEGQSNMYPTAVSQLIEAVSRMALGLAAAYAVKEFALKSYEATGTVFGKAVPQGEEVLNCIYPYSAAGAILGVTFATLISMIYLILRHRIKGESFDKTELLQSEDAGSDREILAVIFKFALPVMVGSLLLNLVSIVDAAVIQSRLAHAISLDSEMIRKIYDMPADVATADIPAYLYGCYNSALDFKNLVPTITASIGVSALPALAGAWELKNTERIKRTVSMVTRLTAFVSLPAGALMAVMSERILSLVYSGGNSDIVSVATPVLTVYSVAMLLFALSSPTISMLHSIGDMTTPVKSLLAGSVIRIALNYFFVGNPKFNIYGAVFGSLASTLAIVSINLAVLLKKTGAKLDFVSSLLKPLIASFACAASAFGCCRLLDDLMPDKLVTVVSALISTIIYIFVTLLIRGIYANDIKMFSFGEKIAKRLEKYQIVR